jgi:hypothetical protein
MGLTLRPVGRFQHGQVHTYVVDLPTSGTAKLELVAAKGWELTVLAPDGTTIKRGLFSTVEDVMAVLTAECFPWPIAPPIDNAVTTTLRTEYQSRNSPSPALPTTD